MHALNWIHEISQSALAAAIMTLGVVILLELRSIARLRSHVVRDMDRLFEQLDLLRFENQQLGEAQAQLPAAAAARMNSAVLQSSLRAARQEDGTAMNAANRLAQAGAAAADIVERCGVPAGEARLLLALQAARTPRAA